MRRLLNVSCAISFFFLAYPACPALYVATSVFNLPCRPARLPGLTLVFPAVPRVPYFTHTLMSSMYPSASRVAEAIAVASDPRSWACILPAGECSSARLVATAVQFACVDERSGSSTSLGEVRSRVLFLFLCETWTLPGFWCQRQKSPIGSP